MLSNTKEMGSCLKNPSHFWTYLSKISGRIKLKPARKQLYGVRNPSLFGLLMDIVSHFNYITLIKNSHHFQEFQVVLKIPACPLLHQVPDDKGPRENVNMNHNIIFIVFLIYTVYAYRKAILSICSSFPLKQQEILKF